jgi:hypothetical protein
MSNFQMIACDELNVVCGGQQAAPGQPAPAQNPRPTPAQDAVNIAASGADLFTGGRSIRTTVNGAQSGWSKGYNLPAANRFERFSNGVGGAVIDAFGLGW